MEVLVDCGNLWEKFGASGRTVVQKKKKSRRCRCEKELDIFQNSKLEPQLGKKKGT